MLFYSYISLYTRTSAVVFTDTLVEGTKFRTHLQRISPIYYVLFTVHPSVE